MKFLVDAQLPRRLCGMLAKHSHDAIYTLDLPSGNESSDASIDRRSMDDSRVEVFKDSDFFISHTLYGRPWKLLLVRTGNISVAELCSLMKRNLEMVVAALETHSLVEIDRMAVTPVRKLAPTRFRQGVDR